MLFVFLKMVKLELILYFLLSLQSLAFALTDPDLKGFDENVVMTPEANYLSASNGFSLMRQGLLIYMLNYPNAPMGVRYDSKKKGDWDDPVEQLIQSMLNVAPGTDSPEFLGINPLANRAAKYLSPRSIGIILNEFHRFETRKTALTTEYIFERIKHDPGIQDSTSKDKASATRIQEQMTRLLSLPHELDPEIARYQTELEELKKQEAEVSHKIGKCLESGMAKTAEPFLELKGALGKIRSYINEKKAPLKEMTKEKQARIREHPEYQVLDQQLASVNYHDSDMMDLLDRLLNAWRAEGTAKSVYPTHLTEQVLVGLAWIKPTNHDKSSFLELYTQIPWATRKLNLTGKWLDPSQPAFSQFSIEDCPQGWMGATDDEKKSTYRTNPGKTAFCMKSRHLFSHETIPTVPYTTAKFKEFRYADCMDSSVLSFVGIVGRTDSNPDTVSFENLCRTLGHECVLSADAAEFSRQNPTVSSYREPKAHDNWARVVSAHEKEGVVYVGGKPCELETRVSNIFALLKTHFFPNLGSSPDGAGLSPSQTMDQLCRFLSRDGFQLGWKLEGETKNRKEDFDHTATNVNLTFFINGESKFAWKITSGHGVIEPLQENMVRDLPPFDALQPSEGVLGDSVKTYFWAHNETGDLGEYRQIQFWSSPVLNRATSTGAVVRLFTPLTSVTSKMARMDQLLNSHPIRGRSVLRLWASIPQSDTYTQIQVFNLILRHNPGWFIHPPYELTDFMRSYQENFQRVLTNPENRSIASDYAYEHGRQALLKWILLRDPANGMAQSRDDLSEADSAAIAYLFSIHKGAREEPPAIHAFLNHKKDFIKWLVRNVPTQITKNDTRYRRPLAIHLLDATSQDDLISYIAQHIPEVMRDFNEGINPSPALGAVQEKKWELVLEIARYAPDAMTTGFNVLPPSRLKPSYPSPLEALEAPDSECPPKVLAEVRRLLSMK